MDFVSAQTLQRNLQLHQRCEEQQRQGVGALQDGHQPLGLRHHLVPDEGVRVEP